MTARESGKVDFEGNTISIIDVDRARSGAPGAELARVRVGTDDPAGRSRPFTLAWTPDGSAIVVADYRRTTYQSSTCAARWRTFGRRGRAHPSDAADGPGRHVRPGNPKGTAITSDGRYAVVLGGPRLDPSAPPSGTVWVIDLRSRVVVATVTGVGNDPYGLTILERPD